MQDTSRVKQLFEYDLWGNRKIADVINVQPLQVPRESIDLFAHIRASQQIWHRRIKGRSNDDIELWPEETAAEDTIEQIKEMHGRWMNLLQEDDGALDRPISYTNSKGTEFTTALGGILDHVIIHGQHHRAQISTLLRKSSITPPATDFIFYLREINK